MQSSKHSQAPNRSQSANELLTDFSSVWNSVDKLKAGLARTEKKLVKASSQDWEDATSLIDKMFNPYPNAKPTRKVCKIGREKDAELTVGEALRESKNDVIEIQNKPNRRRSKTNWNELFRKQENINQDYTTGSVNEMNFNDGREIFPSRVSSNTKMKYLNDDIPQSELTSRPKTAPETSRLSAGYDPSEQNNKFFDRNGENSKELKLHKTDKMNSIHELDNNDKNSPRKRSFKEQKIGSWNELAKKADSLQKLEELVEKQQTKLIKRAKSAPDGKISSKPSKPIIPISISSQNTVTSSQRVDAPPVRKIAPAPSVTPYPGFSDPRRLEPRNLSVVKGRKNKIDKTVEKKSDVSNKKTVTKKVAKITGSIEDYIICPTSWRKGQELVLKELGPFKLPTGEKANDRKEKIDDTETKKSLLPVYDVDSDSESKSVANQLATDVAKNVSQGKDVIKNSKSEDVSQSKDKSDYTAELSGTDSISESITASKSSYDKNKRQNLQLNSKRKLKYTESEQLAPKVRHYNPDEVRNYMQKQKKERLQLLLSEKQKKQKEKKEREQKLQDLQRLQKKLAKAATPKHAENKKDFRENDWEKDDLLSEAHSNTSLNDSDVILQPEIENNDDDEKVTNDPGREDTHLGQENEPPVIILDMSKSEPVKQEFREINTEEIYKKIQDFDNLLASIKISQELKPRNSADKLGRIHATAVSLQHQIDDEANRITRILHQNNTNDVRLDEFYQQTLNVNGEGSDSASPMPSEGQGEASRSSRENSAFSTREFITRHERIVRSRSQFSVFDGNLPGVTNLVRHAQTVASYQVREAAAKKIQAAYRGFKVRQSLKWRILKKNKENYVDTHTRERGGNEMGDVVSPLSEGTISDDADIDSGKNLSTIDLSGKQKNIFADAHFEFLNLLPLISKPDPYNFINTLHRTINQVNVFPEPSQANISEDIDEYRTSDVNEMKDAMSIYSDDFERNSDTTQDPRMQPMGAEADELVSKSLSISHSQLETSEKSVTSEVIANVEEEETLSEGSLSSDFENNLNTLSPVFENTQENTVSKSELENIREEGKDSTVSTYLKNKELKFSPSTLKLKMSSELMYLESLEDSLRHMDHVERIQGVGLARQETVSLAQALQTERQKRLVEVENYQSIVQQEASAREKQLAETQQQQQAALTAAIESVNLVRSEATAAINSTTHKLFNTHAEAAKVTADAAKQLADASVELTRDVGEITKGTATSAAIAAVTSVLKELHKNPSRKDFMYNNSSSDYDRNDSRTSTGNESRHDEVHSRERKLQTPSRSFQSVQSVTSGTTPSKSIPEEVASLNTKSTLNTDTFSEGSLNETHEDKSVSYSTQFEDTNSDREVARNTGRRSASTDDKNDKVSKDENFKISLPTSVDRLTGSDVFENGNDKRSFNNFTLEMVKQYMKKEEMRAKQEMYLLKLREKSLIEQTEAEVALLMLQKQQYRDKGEEDKMPPLRKRQRWLKLRLQQQQSEIRRLREAQLVASQERQLMLEQQQQIAQLRQSTRQILGRIREISPGMQIPSLKSLPSTSRSLDVSPKSSLRLQVLSSSDTIPTDEEINNKVTDTQSDVGEVMSDIQTPGSRDSKSDSELQIEVSDTSYRSSLAGRVLHGLKKLERNKRKLTLREQKLLQRRKDVENLLAWREKLEMEEIKVKAMEEKAMKRTNVSNIPLDINLSDIPEEVFSGPKSSLEPISVVEESKLEEGTLDSSITEDLSSPDGPINEKVKTKSFGTDQEVKTGGSLDYGNSFESTTSQAKSVSSDKQVSVPSVSLRLPLSPRIHSKRRDSSGSEDSFTVSQSETASDLSDIEGRVHALKEELRRRKVEADRLRKEQKRRNKERLKAQEASLLKQIEAYDRFISQAKTELDHELEVDTQVKVTKPQIRQPKVAESRHLVKIQNTPSVHGWSEGAGDEFNNSQYQVSPKGTPRDDTIASSLSELTMNETNKSSSLEEEKSSDQMDSGDQLKSARQDEEDGDGKATESEASSSDSVKTVTEKTEDLNQVQSDKDESKTSEQSPAISQLEIENSRKEEKILDAKDVKAFERSPSDDETIAEEIVDEEVEVIIEGLVSEATRVPRDDKITGEIDHSNPVTQDTQEHVGNENESELASPVHTSSASSSSTYQDRKLKIDNVFKEKIETLISSLVQKELDDAVVEVGNRLKKRKKYEASNFFCNVMTEELMKSLYDSNINLVFEIYKKRIKPSSPITVGHRVRAIMSEFEQKSTNSSPQERPSMSDILSLSSPNAYSDVLTSPEGSPSLSESPARAEGLESPLSRSLSPILGFSNEQFQAQSDKLSDSDLPPEQDWFEDDIDGTNNYYQIYPYKQSYIIREIPNKAPPPYTPPHQSASGSSMFSMTPSLLSIRSDSMSDNLNHYMASHTEAEIQTLVARATTLVHSSLIRGESSIIPPDNYYIIQATDDENRISDSGQSAFRHFIFDLTSEIVTDAHFAAREPPRPPWMKPKWVSQRRPGPISRSSADLIAYVQKQVFGLIKGKTSSVSSFGSLDRKSASLTVISRKKQDRVDEILVKELREEELDWVTYEDDEVSVKMKLADTILNCLLSETAQVIYAINERRRGPQR